LRHLKEGDPLPYFTPSWKEKALTWDLSLAFSWPGQYYLVNTLSNPIKREDRIYPLPQNEKHPLKNDFNIELNSLLSCTN